ncbi:hypothetical protein [Cognatiyoonia sp. IB215182]|uniref:hypothetical protein n=1 Tax=Cognatiyoonia sp. IB215182 TaxID=3097353 RepID=UPI002A0D74BC|nr:hypothetical protein [Cognatiyoonia sp. IB215182]MDX8353608.1 hypothetical protein [Cognatiyoonia sp. IB215182]
MIRAVLYAGILIGSTSTLALAQQLDGAEIGLELQRFSDISETNTSYYGGVEVAISPIIGFGADASFTTNSENSDNVTSLTLHGIYNGGPSGSSLGLFYSIDSVDDDDANLFGAEAAFAFGRGRVDSYIGAGASWTIQTPISVLSASISIMSLATDLALVLVLRATIFRLAMATAQSGRSKLADLTVSPRR